MAAPVEGSATTTNQIQLDWSAMTSLVETGNTFSISSYNLEVFDSGTQSFAEIVGQTSPFTATTYTVTDLTMGQEYLFRIRAENVHGFGPYSDLVTVRADDKPGYPGEVSTTANGLLVDFAWTAPLSNNGSPITEYKLLIRNAQGDMLEEETLCNSV